MAEFAYNNAKNASTGYNPFKLNGSYHSRVSFEKNVDPRLKFRSTNELAEELKELINVCYQNLFHTQELQKRAYNKRVKSCNYAPSEKI